MRYDRTIIAYHGCDEAVARRLLQGEKFKPSHNDYDWLGSGIYFWEYGPERALRFANDQKARGKVRRPTVVGAILQLGNCFDLMDTRHTTDLANAYPAWEEIMRKNSSGFPRNEGSTGDRSLRRLDCAVINWFLGGYSLRYDTVRCGFVEGRPIYGGACIYEQSHVQIAVRNPDCVLGVFRPMMEAR